MNITIPLSKPDLSSLERKYLLDAYDSGWISGTGPYIHRLERALAARCGRKYAVACTNGTVALQLALQALYPLPSRGGEVIVPALTFAAPAAAAVSSGLTPYFVDVYANTWNISGGAVAKAINKDTRAIIAVDVLGMVANFDDIEAVAGRIPIIEDAAEAHGAMHGGRPAGSFGLMSTFSFFGNKVISSGEGGAVLTDNPFLAEEMMLIRSHGMHPEMPYVHHVVGQNFRMTNLTAALLLAQVERWDELIERRRAVFDTYDARFKGLIENTSLWRRPGENMMSAETRESPWMYCLHHPQRERILSYLRQSGIDARRLWQPIPDNLPYQKSPAGDLTNTRHIAGGAFLLPTYAGLQKKEIHYICNRLQEIVERIAEEQVEAL